MVCGVQNSDLVVWAVWSVLSSYPRLLITVYVTSHRYATIDIP